MKFTLALVLLWFPISASSQNIYFGNLHAHTSYSDGRGKPEDAFESARAAGLDFLAVTEHNHAAADGKGDANDGVLIATKPQLYAGSSDSLIETAERLTVPGQFVGLYGQEFSTISQGNHVNVFDVPIVIDVENGHFDELVSWASPRQDSTGSRILMQFNHPRSESQSSKDYGRDDYRDERAWIAALDPFVELIEVLNAPALRDGEGFQSKAHEREYFRYLNLGFHISPSAGHDNHHRNWGRSTDARIAIIAPDLTKAAILQAMKQRHTYATEDKNLRIIFRANGGLGGDIVSPPQVGSELDLTVFIQDADEPDANYRVDVFKDVPGGKPASAPVESFEIDGNTPNHVRLDGVTFSGLGEFVLLRVTQFSTQDPDSDDEHGEEDRAWTAPVWFETVVPPQVPSSLPSIRIVSMVPNPVGNDTLKERVTLRNEGSKSVSFAGWKLRDLAENLWSLDGVGTLAPGKEISLSRNGQPLSLNNQGDTVELLDASGSPVDTVKYGDADEGEIVVPEHL